MTITYLTHRTDRALAFQEQRIRMALAVPSTRSACVPPLTPDQADARYWSAAKASHMRAAALRQPQRSPSVSPMTQAALGRDLGGRERSARTGVQFALALGEES